jgi:MauM/NapG family ferredoxin protein
VDRLARKATQLGFLLLFLYPLLPGIFSPLVGGIAPVITSWLLPWDPLLFAGHLAHRHWSLLVIGGPLLIMACTLLLGRAFCGWICPLGTVLDLARPLARRRRRDGRAPGRGRGYDQSRAGAGRWPADLFPGTHSGPVRYVLLVAVLAGSALSLQALGALDPLVIFSRTVTGLASDFLALNKPILRVYVTASAVFLAVIVLEMWQPRFWCRHLCPLGALLSLPARWSLLSRRVSAGCNDCGLCRRQCAMRAIPDEGHDTRYADCHMCLECESACPRGAISFRFGALSGMRWQRTPEGLSEGGEQAAGRQARGTRFAGRYVLRESRPLLTRRSFMTGLAAAAAGLALPATLHVRAQTATVRPPGALPEADFLRTCILCQECVRVCPGSALRPSGWQAGASGIGTPQLVPRQGGCLIWTSCPNLCAQVCPVGALRPITKREKQAVRIGRALVERTACLAWDQGVKCLVCVEACPTGAAQPLYGKVTVDPQKCIGCGLCEHACPVANGAIHVRPVT